MHMRPSPALSLPEIRHRGRPPPHGPNGCGLPGAWLAFARFVTGMRASKVPIADAAPIPDMTNNTLMCQFSSGQRPSHSISVTEGALTQ